MAAQEPVADVPRHQRDWYTGLTGRQAPTARAKRPCGRSTVIGFAADFDPVIGWMTDWEVIQHHTSWEPPPARGAATLPGRRPWLRPCRTSGCRRGACGQHPAPATVMRMLREHDEQKAAMEPAC
ncbi:hypothetical protein [Streptomyces goshikiensis]|uniref:hypothetical protein n=1 Tax=Streptomyces goshikiensis TaxID=1942 RepID=UPI003662EF26